MRKLLTNLILILCFGSFISATSGLCYKQKNPSNTIDSNIYNEEKTAPQEDINMEIHPLNILSFRIN